MPASIAISGLSWSLPDGRPLFSGLDLTFTTERVGLIGRNGVGKSTLFGLITGKLVPHAGRIAVTGTIGALAQSVQSAPGATLADLFGITGDLARLDRAEAGLAGEEDLARADWTLPGRLAEALSKTGLDLPPDAPLANLSGGQTTRAALAALVFSAPDFLLLDEPTNHLDRDGRRAVVELLAGWRKGAVVISHDRELLDTLDAMVELTSLGATRHGGNWSHYRARRTQMLATAQAELAEAEKRLDDVVRAARMTVERQARKDSAGRKKAARGDAPRILLGAMKNRAEGTGGSQARLADRRHSDAVQAAETARRRIEVLQPFTVGLPPTGLPAQRSVIRLDHVRAGYAPERPILDDLSFALTGPERIAVTGPNGSGKTTLLRIISGTLEPWSGTVQVTSERRQLDQAVTLLDPARSIRDNFRRLHPQSDENACRAALARFMFRADSALQTVSTLSGGQRLRAGLACALGGAVPPELLILDEPTNHLDMEAIEAVEAGLAAYDGALLVVSHDEGFLDGLSLTGRLDLPAAPPGPATFKPDG